MFLSYHITVLVVFETVLQKKRENNKKIQKKQKKGKKQKKL